MPSAWIVTRTTSTGAKRYRVEYRLGGRESKTRYGGSFERKAEAVTRMRWILGELAAMRAPDLAALADPPAQPSLGEACDAWLRSRIDVAENTLKRNRQEIARIFRFMPALRAKPIDKVTHEDVIALIAALRGADLAPATIRLTSVTLSMVFDFSRTKPNPARDDRVKLPRQRVVHIPPPLADHVEAVADVIPVQHVLPFLTLEATGYRISVLMASEIGDLDEELKAIRSRPEEDKREKYGLPQIPPDLWQGIIETLPERDQRDPRRRLFADSSATALRQAIYKACKATGVPSVTPHGLRRRRGSLHYHQTRSLTAVADLLRDSRRVASDNYIYAMTDYREVDRTSALARVRAALASVPPSGR